MRRAMISRDEEVAIAQGHIDRPSHAGALELVVTQVQERNASWVVYYDSRKHVETGDILDAIAGNGPVVVAKGTGRIAVAGTAAPLLDRIVEAEEVLGIKVR